MATEPDKHTNKNILWAIPIALYLLTQTTMAVWWASTVNANIVGLQNDVQTIVDDAKESNEIQNASIRQNSTDITKLNNSLVRTSTNLENVDEQLSGINDELRETNNLFRQYLLDKSKSP